MFEETQAESIRDASDWLDKNQLAQKGEFEAAQEKLYLWQAAAAHKHHACKKMDWVEVKKGVRQKNADNEDCRMVQIFVKMDGFRTITMEVAPNDKVSDVMKRILSGGDVYVTSGGSVLRTSDELRSCGVVDESTVQVVSWMRGGGVHTDKQNKAEKKQVSQERDKSRSATKHQRVTGVQRFRKKKWSSSYRKRKRIGRSSRA